MSAKPLRGDGQVTRANFSLGPIVSMANNGVLTQADVRYWHTEADDHGGVQGTIISRLINIHLSLKHLRLAGYQADIAQYGMPVALIVEYLDIAEHAGPCHFARLLICVRDTVIEVSGKSGAFQTAAVPNV